MCEVTKNVRSELVLAQEPRTIGRMPLKSEVSSEAGTSFKVLKRVIVLERAFKLLLISVVF